MTDREKLAFLMDELLYLEREGHDLLADGDGDLVVHVSYCHGCLANDILSRLFEMEMNGSDV